MLVRRAHAAGGHMIIIEMFERWRQPPRTTALHATNREKFAVTRHGPPQFTAAAPSLRSMIAPSFVSDAPKHPLASDPHRQRHQIQRQLGQITSRSTVGRDFATLSRNRITHRPTSVARGFVPRRLSYASRRPQLFTEVEWQLSAIRKPERTWRMEWPANRFGSKRKFDRCTAGAAAARRGAGIDGAGAPGGAPTHQRVRKGTMALNALRPLLEEAHQQFWQRSRCACRQSVVELMVNAAVATRPRSVTPISSSVSATACIASDMSASVTSPMQPMRKVFANARRPGKMIKPRLFMPSKSA